MSDDDEHDDEPLPTVIQALANVMRDVTHVGKTDKNDFHQFLFRGIDTVLDHVGPALRKHGVVPAPILQDLQSRDVAVGKDKTAREITVKVAYVFTGPAGDTYVGAVVPGEAQDTGDKAVAKAMSVAYRTALIQALALATQELDPDAATYERAHDPLLPLKNKVMAAAKTRGWDIDQLAADYAEWSQGGDIRAADADTLNEYLGHLNPPKRMRRKPLEDSSNEQQ